MTKLTFNPLYQTTKPLSLCYYWSQWTIIRLNEQLLYFMDNYLIQYKKVNTITKPTTITTCLNRRHFCPPFNTFTTLDWCDAVTKPFPICLFSKASSNFCVLSSTSFIKFLFSFMILKLSSSFHCSSSSLFWSSKSFIFSLRDLIATSFSSSFFFRKILSTLYRCCTTTRS